MASADGNEVSEVSGFGFKGCGVWGQSLRAVNKRQRRSSRRRKFWVPGLGNKFRALGPISGPFNKRFGRAHSPIRGPRGPCSQAFAGPLSQKKCTGHLGPIHASGPFEPGAVSGLLGLIGPFRARRPLLGFFSVHAPP